MRRHLIAPFLALIAGSATLQAQLVETPRPSPRKTTSAKPRATPAPKPELKLLDKKLADFGITPRSLGTWRNAGGNASLAFLEISFRRIQKPSPDSMERPRDPRILQADGRLLVGYQVEGADFLAKSKDPRDLALLRLNREAPQASTDGGRTWIDGEKVGEGWIFAFEGETLTILPADENFTPTETKSWALERATVTRLEPSARPYFHSAVVSVAYGRNEIQGLVKYPGTAFVLTFRGIRFKDRWVARSLEIQSLNGVIFNAGGQPNPNPGIGPLKADERQFPQLELSENRLQIGTGPTINYGQDGDSAEQLRDAVEFDLTKGKPLPELAAAHKSNLNRTLWTQSDEDGSFGREAERAFVQAGLTTWFYASRRETGFEQGGGRSMKPMLERLQRLGAKVDFIPVR